MDDYDYSTYSHDFFEFKDLIEKTTANLRKMSEMQRDMRWQFGEPEWYTKFVEEMKEAQDGWMSSNC